MAGKEIPFRPAKGTPEYKLWLAAIEVAVRAPLKRGPSTGSAQIYWPLIDDLREALDEVGIDWREAKRRQTQRARGRA